MKFTINKTPNLFFVHLKLMLANLLRATLSLNKSCYKACYITINQNSKNRELHNSEIKKMLQQQSISQIVSYSQIVRENSAVQHRGLVGKRIN